MISKIEFFTFKMFQIIVEHNVSILFEVIERFVHHVPKRMQPDFLIQKVRVLLEKEDSTLMGAPCNHGTSDSG